MSKIKIDEKLLAIQGEKSFDDSFLTILFELNENDETAVDTAKKVIKEIERRYAEDKKD